MIAGFCGAPGFRSVADFFEEGEFARLGFLYAASSTGGGVVRCPPAMHMEVAGSEQFVRPPVSFGCHVLIFFH